MATKSLPRIIFIAALGAFTFLSSCKKDNDNYLPGKEPLKERKISKLFQDEKNFIEFTYDTDGRLWKVIATDEDTPGGPQRFEISYNNQQRIKSIITQEGYHIAYRYENNRLAATEMKDELGNIFTSGSFYYENGNLVDYGSFLPFPLEDGNDGILYKRVSESKYTYNADKTIATISQNLLNPLTNRLESAGHKSFEKYDGKINPFRHLGDFAYGFFQELNPSNVVKETSYDAAGAVGEIIERVFTYDNAGYPLTCVEKTTVPGQPAVSKQLTFSYQ